MTKNHTWSSLKTAPDHEAHSSQSQPTPACSVSHWRLQCSPPGMGCALCLEWEKRHLLGDAPTTALAGPMCSPSCQQAALPSPPASCSAFTESSSGMMAVLLLATVSVEYPRWCKVCAVLSCWQSASQMRVHAYIYIHTNTHICIYTHTHIYTYVCIYTHAHMHWSSDIGDSSNRLRSYFCLHLTVWSDLHGIRTQFCGRASCQEPCTGRCSRGVCYWDLGKRQDHLTDWLTCSLTACHCTSLAACHWLHVKAMLRC